MIERSKFQYYWLDVADIPSLGHAEAVEDWPHSRCSNHFSSWWQTCQPRHRAHWKGSLVLAVQVGVFRLLFLSQPDGIELQVSRTANKICLFHRWCIISSYPCCKVCCVFLLVLYFCWPTIRNVSHVKVYKERCKKLGVEMHERALPKDDGAAGPVCVSLLIWSLLRWLMIHKVKGRGLLMVM